ncbi:Major Facilitator Superfamily protein [Methylobacterium phyllostachyos]|uniref:Major Facilitator Superfamily protein n=1 Tax=Methylobacterium phyllostachyos TaxID=582672 RepID=A0A1H0CDS9_9HYPH|nr:MFS transporter [Methylobacterium phyllostachyos]SDN56054.1 Major Facilitator Superfamily protein [Methylobacterium phyllostachyos]
MLLAAHFEAMQYTVEHDAWSGRARLTAVTLGFAAALTNFDVTSVVVVLPSIGTTLGIHAAQWAWIIDAYSIAFTATLLVAGAVADRFGKRHTLLAGNVGFLVTSLACGLAWNSLLFLIARAAQGATAAFLVTGGFASIATAFPAAESRARAFGVAGMASGVAMALGPSLGGVIGAGLGWRWIFFFNLPLCMLIALMVPRLVAEERDGTDKPLDWLGIALLTIALALLIETILEAHDAPVPLAFGLGTGGRTCCIVRHPAAQAATADARSGGLCKPTHDGRDSPALRRLGRLLGRSRLPPPLSEHCLRLDGRDSRAGNAGGHASHARHASAHW